MDLQADKNFNSQDLSKGYNKSERIQKIRALSLVCPLFIFLIIFFLLPIGMMLLKSFYHATVYDLIPQTSQAISSWDKKQLPNEDTYKTFAQELKALADNRNSGKLAIEVNRTLAGSSASIKSAARALRRIDLAEITSYKEWLIEQNASWGQKEIWFALYSSSQKFTLNYFFRSLDFQVGIDGISASDDPIYVPIALKTLLIALTIVLLTFLLAYPTAYYLSQQPDIRANLLMVCVLLPFWTSLLVRTTSWIVLLQDYGVINSILMNIGITDKPFSMLYNRYSTIVAMTHILLPFMILPIYSVMKKMDVSVIRASSSLGANPLTTFFKVYFPLSLPGVSAGVVLVFIISIGYYITPALVGGVDGQMISNLVAYHMKTSGNWELASALASMLLFAVLICYFVYDKLVGVSNIKLG